MGLFRDIRTSLVAPPIRGVSGGHTNVVVGGNDDDPDTHGESLLRRAFTIFRPKMSERFGLSGNLGADSTKFIKSFNSLVYACATVRAKEVANAGRLGKFKVMTEEGFGDYKLVRLDHPLFDLLRNPNPYMSRWELWYITALFMDITGNAYWWLAKDAFGVPREAWLVPSDVCSAIVGDPSKGEDIIRGYTIDWGPGKVYEVPADDIVHFKHPSLESPYWTGDSLVAKAAVEIDIDKYISEHQRDFFKNDATPGLIITFPTILKDGVRKEFEKRWIEKFLRRPNQPAFLEGGATVTPLVNQRELDYLNTRGVNTKRIQSVFGVPDSKLMMSETITARATLETIEYNFQKETIDPLLTLIDERLTMDLARVYFGPKFIVRHETTVPKDIRAEAEIDNIYFNIGVTSINEIRRRRAEDPIEHGDVHYVPFNAIPVEYSINNPNAGGNAGPMGGKEPPPEPDEDDQEEEDGKSFYKQYPDALTSDEARSDFWLAFENNRLHAESHVYVAMKNFFTAMEKKIVQSVESEKKLFLSYRNGDPNVTHVKFESQQLADLVFGFLNEFSRVYGDEATMALRNGFEDFVRRNGLEGLLFSSSDPEVVTGIRVLTARTRSVLQNLHDELASDIQAGIDKGESVEQLAERISKFFANTVDERSFRIARTVSTYAVNKGANVAAKKSQIFSRKMWITERDGRVRNLHQPMDGVTVGINSQFELMNGDKLDIPGDPRASRPESVVRCRCVAFYMK